MTSRTRHILRELLPAIAFYAAIHVWGVFAFRYSISLFA